MARAAAVRVPSQPRVAAVALAAPSDTRAARDATPRTHFAHRRNALRLRRSVSRAHAHAHSHEIRAATCGFC
jgi:hypothetical protein